MCPSIAHLLVLLLTCLLLTGCFGSGRELDETTFALALGLDMGEDGELEISYQLSSEASKGEAGGGNGDQAPVNADVITIKASSTAESRSLLNSLIAPAPDMSHTKVLVVSEKLARQGVQDIISPIVRFREYRGSMFVVVCRGSAKDFLKAYKPLTGINPAKYYEEMLQTASKSNFYPPTQLHEFYLALKTYSSQPYAPYAAINPSKGEDKGKAPVPDGKERQYTAGSIPRSGGNPLEFAGMAVFKGNKMVGVLTTHETRAWALLSGKLSPHFMTVQDPLVPKMTVMAHIGLMEKPKIEATLQDGQPVFDISVELEGEIYSIASGINYEQAEYRTLLQQQISNVYTEEINAYLRKTQELGTDVAGFGYHLRSNFNTIDEFFAYNWNDKYQNANIRVHVKTVLRRTGLMRKSSPIADKQKE